MKKDESTNPADVGLLRPMTQVAHPGSIADPVEEPVRLIPLARFRSTGGPAKQLLSKGVVWGLSY
ncbi:MAG: hypothetical protein OEN01_05980 [Candidatus Krumholzibacteria bacterium]|nr:hypothetical protein [Candidatus Krumholzibacteria bacterium]